MVESDQQVRTRRRSFTVRRASRESAHGPTSDFERISGVASTVAVQEHDESGAILILALAFLLVVSVIVASLASWTMNNLNNTLQFQSAGSRLYAAEGATQVALRASRYTYPTNTSGVSPANMTGAGYQCPGETTPLTSVNGLYVEDWCVTVIPLVNLSGPPITREVTLTACQVPSASSTLSSNCSGTAVLLTAVIYIDDYDANKLNTGCTSVANESTCGNAMFIVSWTPGT